MNSNNKGQIECGQKTVEKVFSTCWFCIPVYQRSYVWGKDEISELIDDVNHASEHSPKGQYFLGSMVLQKHSTNPTDKAHPVNFDQYDVLDGQQRLTTLFLMIAVIRDLIQNDKTGIQLRNMCGGMLCQEERIWDNTPGRDRLVYKIRDNVDEFINEFVKPENGTAKTKEPICFQYGQSDWIHERSIRWLAGPKSRTIHPLFV
jgi:hypothetical protein